MFATDSVQNLCDTIGTERRAANREPRDEGHGHELTPSVVEWREEALAASAAYVNPECLTDPSND